METSSYFYVKVTGIRFSDFAGIFLCGLFILNFLLGKFK